MIVELTPTACIVTREHSDPGFGTESTLLHYVKLELIKQGHDVVKRRMHKDGHMMGDDTTQYIRERGGAFYVYDHLWAVRSLIDDWNADRVIKLSVQFNTAPEVKQS